MSLKLKDGEGTEEKSTVPDIPGMTMEPGAILYTGHSVTGLNHCCQNGFGDEDRFC